MTVADPSDAAMATTIPGVSLIMTDVGEIG
jgi:hypothetical protein